MLPGKKYAPDEVLRILLRRWWLVVAPLVLGTVASFLVARELTDLYQSETLIMVIPQRIPDSYVKATDTTTIEDRLPSITEQIQSRSRLERIINEFSLYPETRARGVMEDVVAKMRADMDVKLEGRDQDSFRVSYISTDPRLAQKVTERLASWYIEENLRDRENLAASTSEFLEAELEDAKRRLIDHEQKLEEYRRRFSGQLPSQLDSNLQAMQSAQLQLQSVGEAINRARERRLLIERQLADLQMPATARALATDGTALESVQTKAQQLDVARTALERARLRYTADHPDIRALERTIAQLQSEVEAEAKAPEAPSKVPSLAETLRQKRIKDYQTELELIDRQIAANQGEQKRLEQRIGDYQAKIDALPSRESELVELTRDYGSLQSTYAGLLEKRENSKLAANLERRQIGEQFKVLDPASLPERPINAKQRLMVLAAGPVGGLGLGLLLIGLLEFRDSSFKTETDVSRVLSLPVLALVPIMLSAQDEQRIKRRRFRARVVTAVAVVVSIAVAGVVFWRLQP
jgi:polysaccharide chain length determinant protein (PEP-CTERM system associated)